MATRGKPFDKTDFQQLRQDAANKQMQAWNTNAYSEITDSDQFRGQLDKLLGIKGDVQLSSDQETELKNTIYNFLMAYHTGNYDDYKAFRMPIAGTIDETHRAILEKFMSKNAHLQVAELDQKSPDDLFKKFVELRSQGTYYKDFFTSVSFQESHIDLASFQAAPQALQNFVVDGTTNLGVASYPPMYSLPRASSATILKEDGSLICATTVLYVKTKEPLGEDLPAPIYLRLVWDKQSKKWLPSELAMGNIWQKSKIIIAF